jgi:hypothetical protein
VLWGLTGNIWPQAAGETQFLFAEVQVTLPAACDGGGPNQPFATIGVFVDGHPIGSAYSYFHPSLAGRTQSPGFSFYPSSALIGPESAQTHVITARALDTCTGAGQEFIFNSLKIDVVSVS